MNKTISIFLFSLMISFILSGCKKESSNNNCAGVNIGVTANMSYTGSITVNVSGGVAPYQFSINGSVFQSGNIFDNRYPDGTYTITVKDVNGCQGSAMLTLAGNICLDARDGQYYSVVTIGSQIWMAKNMNYATSSGWYCLDDIPANCDTFGKLYEHYAALSACPNGWHLPDKSEFITLLSYFGTSAYPHLIAGGDSGFNGLFAGQKLPSGVYDSGRLMGMWWASSESVAGYADGLQLSSYSNTAMTFQGLLFSNSFSVRCIKN